MKKIIHRDIFGANPRKREVSVDETIFKSGTTIRKRRSCKYFVSEKKVSADIKELEFWIKNQKARGLKKNCHVFRELNTSTGINKVICKVMGEFFAVWGSMAFKIFYVNEVKLEFGNSKRENG
ncbi:MAG: hypothetical protein WCV56_02265 [Candidatus Omnitrophota bacterium]